MTEKTLEVRVAALGPVELRAADDGLGSLHGYAAVYNRYSQNLGGFVEMVDPAAFRKSLADAVPVMARYNHAHLLGTTEARTLTLESDDTGLAYDVVLPDTSVGRDCRALAARGDLRYSSFAFRTIEDEWSLTEQGFPLRILRAVQLVDVAPVDDPAYRDTTVAARALQERVGVDLREISELDTEDLRERLTKRSEPVGSDDTDREGQRATHPALSLRSLQLQLDRLR